MDVVTPSDRLERLASHWLDWPEAWWLRYRHYRAWNEWRRHQNLTAHHRELAGEALHEAQFWRNRQIERGKNVSYDPGELNIWLDWAMGAFIGLAVVCLLAGLVLRWFAR